MDWGYWLKGVTIGFAIAAPVGPIGVLCIQRTLAYGAPMGLLTGAGAASADAVYGAMAGFGMVMAAQFFADQRIWLALVGGAFLCYLGVRTILSAPPPIGTASVAATSALAAFGSTFLLTLTNPMTILAFLGILSDAGIDTDGETLPALLLVLGVFSGSLLWWLLLSSGVSLLRKTVSGDVMRWVNRAAGAVITGFGVSIILRGIGMWG